MTAPMPFKLRVLYGLTDALRTICPDDGYSFDLRDFVDDEGVTVPRVYRGRAWFGDSDPMPMISILEGPTPAGEIAAAPPGKPVAEYDWDLIVQGFVKDDPAHPTDPAYPLLADVRRRLAIECLRKAPGTNQPDPFGIGISGKNRLLSLKIGPGVVRPADDISSNAWLWLGVTLRIIDNAEAPFL